MEKNVVRSGNSDWISGVISLDGTKEQLWITAGSNLYDEENNRYDHYPTDMMKQGLTKRTHIDQVSNAASPTKSLSPVTLTHP